MLLPAATAPAAGANPSRGNCRARPHPHPLARAGASASVVCDVHTRHHCQHPGRVRGTVLRAVSTASIGAAIAGVGPKHDQLLAAQGITTVEDLERVHFELHLADLGRTRQYLQDVVGIKSKTCIKNLLNFLDSLDTPAPPSAASVYAPGLEIMTPYEPIIMNIMSTRSSSLSLDRLQNMLLASNAEPRYDRSREDLAAYLSYLVAQGKIVAENAVYKYKSMDPANGRAGSPLTLRPPSPQPRRGSPTPSRVPSPTPRVGGSRAPSPSRGSSQPASSLNGTGRGSSKKSEVREVENSSSSTTWSAPGTGSTPPVDADEEADLELAQFEGQVLDLLQNYSGLTLERLEPLLVQSRKEPRYKQGPARLQLLLNAMAAQGTISDDAGTYRYKSRTPQPERPRSPQAQRQQSPVSGKGSSSSNRGSSSEPSRAAPTPSRSTQPTNRGSSWPQDAASLAELATYEESIMDLLQKYSGLPLERLSNMLRLSAGTSLPDATPEQLEPLLDTLVEKGQVSFENGVYRLPGRSGSVGPSSSSASSRSSPLPATALRSPSPMSKQDKASSSRGQEAASSPAPPMADIGTFEPVIMDLLQNYAGLSAERLNGLLASSSKAQGYRASTNELVGLLSKLVAEGKIADDAGTFRFRSKTPDPVRGKSTAAPPMRASSSSPTVSRTSDSSSSSSAASPVPSPPALAPPRTGSPNPGSSIAAYEPAVLELLQNYAGLSLERLDRLIRSSPKAPGYNASKEQLALLLSSLAGKGRVNVEDGIYRYRTTGKTPQLKRAAPASSSSGATGFSSLLSSGSNSLGGAGFKLGSPVGAISEFLETARRSISPVPSRASSAPPPSASSLSPAPRAATPAAQPTPPEWAPYENTLMSMLTNYGALPVDRLHEMLGAAMVWPRYDMPVKDLRAYLDGQVSQGRLASEGGLYSKPGAGAPRPSPGSAAAAGLGAGVAEYEDQVVEILGKYTGLTLTRLHNMMRLSAQPPFAQSEEMLGALLANLQGQGKVELRNGMYSSARPASPSQPPSRPSPNRESSPLPESMNTGLDGLGFPTAEGIFGYTPLAEITNGRFAMLGFLASVVQELRTDGGTLEQLGFLDMPSMDTTFFILAATGSAAALSLLVQGARYAAGGMSEREISRYQKFFSFQSQELAGKEKFYTDQLKYARTAELANGRAAMLGLLAGLLMETLTGRGIVGQVVLYLKVSGLLDSSSGF